MLKLCQRYKLHGLLQYGDSTVEVQMKPLVKWITLTKVRHSYAQMLIMSAQVCINQAQTIPTSLHYFCTNSMFKSTAQLTFLYLLNGLCTNVYLACTNLHKQCRNNHKLFYADCNVWGANFTQIILCVFQSITIMLILILKIMSVKSTIKVI